MPLGSLPKAGEFIPGVDAVLCLRRMFQVSAEAVLLRLLQTTPYATVGFAAHCNPGTSRYLVDYVTASPSMRESVPVRPGFVLPKESRAAECTAIGYTAKGQESWLKRGPWDLEYIGISPYPGHQVPRVLGIAKPPELKKQDEYIHFIKGDATEPRGDGPKILCQIVNDKARTWGLDLHVRSRTSGQKHNESLPSG